jgi:hypothetical protein
MRTFSSERLESTYSSLDQHFGAYLRFFRERFA